jgi:hypothetical protein
VIKSERPHGYARYKLDNCRCYTRSPPEDRSNTAPIPTGMYDRARRRPRQHHQPDTAAGTRYDIAQKLLAVQVDLTGAPVEATGTRPGARRHRLHPHRNRRSGRLDPAAAA